MYIATVPNRNSPPAILLRAGYREGGKVKSRTLANLSKWPRKKIETLRLLLKGEKLAPLGRIFEIAASRRRVRERAVLAAAKRLRFAMLLAPAPSPERDAIMDLIIALILAPQSEEGTVNAEERDRALDWLSRRQDRIEKKLGLRYLDKGGLALLSLNSNSREDGLRMDRALLTDVRGRPVSIAVRTGDAGTPWMPRIQRMKADFGVGPLALVADRGDLSEERLAELKAGGLDWIVPLNARAIRKLVDDRTILPELFDRRGLLEFSHAGFPGERFAARRDEKLRGIRARKRRAALAATSRALTRLRALAGKDYLAANEIETKARGILDERGTAKFFALNVEAGTFNFRVDEAAAAAEAALDGVSVLRTSLAAQRLSAEGIEGAREFLGRTNRILRAREEAAPAQYFLSMLACSLERQMRRG